MSTREIPQAKWIKFFDDFSKQHEGWIVTMEVLSSDLGDQEEVNGLPLVGISADLKDRENRIEIIAGGRIDADVTRIIDSPKRIWFKQPEVVGDEAIDVESEDGTKTLVTFKRIPPERFERQLPK